MAASPSYSPAWTVVLISLNYVVTILWPLLALISFLFIAPSATLLSMLLVGGAWMLYISRDGAEYRTGRPDKLFSQTHWVFMRMREYLSVSLHRTPEVQSKLLKANPTGQAIFAFFPHGVNSDFRVLMDGLMYDAFPDTYAKAPGRTLAASVLFKLPGVRQLSLATACVDAGRKTATKCLRDGLSLLLCPGGQDEQLETIYGRERVFLRKRAGFIRLAIIHQVPVVPAFCFGSSDLYYTSRFAHPLRNWLVRNLRVALPLYSGGPGLFMYPTPMGFPLPKAQSIVFGDPITFPHAAEPTSKEVSQAHEAFIAALTNLFDTHKAAYGCAGRTLEIL